MTEHRIAVEESDGRFSGKSFANAIAVTVTAAIIVGALGGAVKAVIDEARLEVRVDTIEHDRNSIATVPAQLATLTSQVADMKTQIEHLADKLDAQQDQDRHRTR